MPPTRATRSSRAGISRLTPSSATSASINRQASDAHHLRITVKAPPSKLRQAISGDDPESDFPDADDSPEPPVRTARSTRNPRTVLDNESDEEQEEDDDDEDEDEDAEGEEDDLENTEMMDADGSDEDADADGDDMDMDSPHPPPPVIHAAPSNNTTKGKPKVNLSVLAPPHKGNLKSVEAKELEDDDEDDDEELSDLQSGDEDMPGAEDDEEELDSDLEGEDGDTTLDLTKLTRRQRAVYDEEQDNSLMALSNEAQKKKHLTAEEHAMRRAEMARRRKNLSEKRNEEEKVRLSPCVYMIFLLTQTSRWTRSTNFSRSLLQNAGLALKSLPLRMLQREPQHTLRTAKNTTSQRILSLFVTSTTRPEVVWVYHLNGSRRTSQSQKC